MVTVACTCTMYWHQAGRVLGGNNGIMKEQDWNLEQSAHSGKIRAIMMFNEQSAMRKMHLDYV